MFSDGASMDQKHTAFHCILFPGLKRARELKTKSVKMTAALANGQYDIVLQPIYHMNHLFKSNTRSTSKQFQTGILPEPI